MMICGGPTSTQNADGFGRQEWMSGFYGNSSTTWMCEKGRKHEEGGLNKDCFVTTVMYESLKSLVRSSRAAAAKYVFL